jgi:hypothetical protein
MISSEENIKAENNNIKAENNYFLLFLGTKQKINNRLEIYLND